MPTRLQWDTTTMGNPDLPPETSDLLEAGALALANGAWEESLACFQAAVASDETPEALEGLGTAAWWLDDISLLFDSHERAYRLYRERGDRAGSARLAIWLGMDNYIHRGAVAVATGWLQRAHRLLDEVEPSFEHGWLAVLEAHISLFEHHDVAAAKTAGTTTVKLAQALDSVDLEMLALALEGLALVSDGQVAEGMRRLDEATAAALAGEMSDPDAIVTTCCYLIYACERVHDFDRANQWCTKLVALCQRWSYRSMLAQCRVHYAAVLMWQGEWQQAETEITLALRELKASRPGWAGEGALRLAELRRRQGRLDDAARLFGQGSAHPLALLGQAEIALTRGQVVLAADLADRFRRRVPAEDRTNRARGYELAVRIHIAMGEIDRAECALTELERTANLVGTDALLGSARFARGLIAVAAGDLDGARCSFEDAVDLFDASGAPFEAAVCRLELVPVLTALDRTAAATAEAQAALTTVRRLGALREAGRAARLLQALDPNATITCIVSTDLTRREVEVLRLIAHGDTNPQIAERLFISVRTVERHISTIYAKIGAEGKAARSLATAYAFERGLLTADPA